MSMKRTIITLLVTCLTVYSTWCKDSLLAVVIMVKNEEQVIVPTLKPFIDGGVDAFVIFDTGSTDATIERATQFLAHSGVSFYIEQEPFVDFSTSRNRALDRARALMPSIPFFIMPDAEWYIQGVRELISFCREALTQYLDVNAFGVGIGNSAISFETIRLFRADRHVRFVGSVHECPVANSRVIKVPDPVYFDWRPSREGNEKTQARLKRDLALLERDVQRNPDDARAVFYLAQTYTVLGDYPKALAYFKRRAIMDGFQEERYVALYRIAQLTELGALRGNHCWGEVLEAYLKAFALDPARAEPLIHLAHYAEQQLKSYDLAYLFAHKACAMSCPDVGLFINKELYEFDRYALLARAAHHLGYRQEARWAAQQALKIKSSDQQMLSLSSCLS